MRAFFSKHKWVVVSVAVLVIGTPSWFIAARASDGGDNPLIARVKRSDFRITVTSSGELRAPKFVNISGPPNMQQAEIWNGVKISTMVAEGTTVKEGEVVAELDRGPVATKMADVTLALQKAEAQFEQASLDSTLNLSKAREDMRTAALTLEEKQLTKDQAKFEAPSVQRQAAIDYEKAFRALRQDSSDYKTKTEQAMAKMREVGSDFERQKNKLKVVQDVMGSFTIKAPAKGMVIYIKDWNGKKRAVGSQVSPWDPGVATLPDMSIMESVTFVNEIDVRKLSVGMPVTLGLDADPSKKISGKVTAVANVGEQRPNSDAKVFEVKVSIEKPDTTLRPGMTTSNVIETHVQKSVLHLPLEAVSSDSGVQFVFRRSGPRIVKQEIETGAMNDDEIVVVRGLKEHDEVMLVPPADKDRMTLARLTGPRTDPAKLAGDTAVGEKQLAVPPPLPPAVKKP